MRSTRYPTEEYLRSIMKWIQGHGVADAQLPVTNRVSSDDMLPIIQGNRNKIINVTAFASYVGNIISGNTAASLAIEDGELVLYSKLGVSMGSVSLKDYIDSLELDDTYTAGTGIVIDGEEISVDDSYVSSLISSDSTVETAIRSLFAASSGLSYNSSSGTYSINEDWLEDYVKDYVSDNVSSYTLPVATSSTLGGVKVGDNLSIDSNGVLDVSGSETTNLMYPLGLSSSGAMVYNPDLSITRTVINNAQHQETLKLTSYLSDSDAPDGIYLQASTALSSDASAVAIKGYSKGVGVEIGASLSTSADLDEEKAAVLCEGQGLNGNGIIFVGETESDDTESIGALLEGHAANGWGLRLWGDSTDMPGTYLGGESTDGVGVAIDGYNENGTATLIEGASENYVGVGILGDSDTYTAVFIHGECAGGEEENCYGVNIKGVSNVSHGIQLNGVSEGINGTYVGGTGTVSGTYIYGENTEMGGYGVYIRGYSDETVISGIYLSAINTKETGQYGIHCTSSGFDYTLYASSIYCSSVTEASDERMKTDVNEDWDALSIVDQLKPVSYKWNDKAKEIDESYDTSSTNYGLIAQNSDGVIDGLVSKGSSEDNMWGVRYTKLIPVLLKAIKELEEKYTNLEERLNTLENNN